MSVRPCLEPGCHALTRKTRCHDHERARDKARGSSTARGYGQSHRKLRDAYQRRMDTGEHFDCWRCGQPINPTFWQLGHDDDDRSVYRGPECPPCNLATSGR